MAITKVWIEEGCIVCNACEAECPDVFHVTEDSCHIKGEARVDGVENENKGKSPLKDDLQRKLEDSIVAAAGGEDLPPAWLQPLAPGGRLVAPMSKGSGQVLVVVDHVVERGVSQWLRTEHEAVLFVPLKSGVL
mgnify:CR=1 FL=1